MVLVMLILGRVWVVEMLGVSLFTRRIACAATVTTALEAFEATTTARETTAAAANDTPDNTQDNQATDNDNTND